MPRGLRGGNKVTNSRLSSGGAQTNTRTAWPSDCLSSSPPLALSMSTADFLYPSWSSLALPQGARTQENGRQDCKYNDYNTANAQ